VRGANFHFRGDVQVSEIAYDRVIRFVDRVIRNELMEIKRRKRRFLSVTFNLYSEILIRFLRSKIQKV